MRHTIKQGNHNFDAILINQTATFVGLSQRKEPLKLIAYKKVGTHGYWWPCCLGILW